MAHMIHTGENTSLVTFVKNHLDKKICLNFEVCKVLYSNLRKYILINTEKKYFTCVCKIKLSKCDSELN